MGEAAASITAPATWPQAGHTTLAHWQHTLARNVSVPRASSGRIFWGLIEMRLQKISDSTPVRLHHGGDLAILRHHDTEAREEKGGRGGHRHPRQATQPRGS